MTASIEQTLVAILGEAGRFGQVLIQRTAAGFVFCHRDDEGRDDLKIFRQAEDAIEISKYDDAGKYRPLKTAPNLQRGWRLELADAGEARRALDCFYPGRLAAFAAWTEKRIEPTPLRETLGRQSGMYRVAMKISDKQIDAVVGNVCRSDGGCLRTILWKRDAHGMPASTRLPPEKFDPAHDQTGRDRKTIPLLCQEICSVLLNKCRNAVKLEGDAPRAPG